jgi:hypothetical protein
MPSIQRAFATVKKAMRVVACRVFAAIFGVQVYNLALTA